MIKLQSEPSEDSACIGNSTDSAIRRHYLAKTTEPSCTLETLLSVTVLPLSGQSANLMIASVPLV